MATNKLKRAYSAALDFRDLIENIVDIRESLNRMEENLITALRCSKGLQLPRKLDVHYKIGKDAGYAPIKELRNRNDEMLSLLGWLNPFELVYKTTIGEGIPATNDGYGIYNAIRIKIIPSDNTGITGYQFLFIGKIIFKKDCVIIRSNRGSSYPCSFTISGKDIQIYKKFFKLAFETFGRICNTIFDNINWHI